MYAACALLSPPYSVLTYSLPAFFPAAFWQAGLRLAVPLGRGEKGALRAAVLLETSLTAHLPEGVACREIAWPLEQTPLLTPDLLALTQALACRQGVELGHVLGHVLPQGLRSTQLRLRSLLGGRARSLSLRQVALASSEERATLAAALCAGDLRFLPSGVDAAADEFCILRIDPPWPVRPSARRQVEVLDYLHERGAVSRRRLIHELGQGSTASLKSLLEAGHVALTREPDGVDEEDVTEAQALLPPPPQPFSLNTRQQAALEALTARLDSGQAGSNLLFGVTGSGKTAVYLE